MKQFIHTLRQKAGILLQNSTATRGRPLSFQIAVAALFTIDVLAFVSFFIIKIMTG